MTDSRPIDSFKQYFLDVKPYHTKILEIVENYNFQEDLDVKFEENIFFNIDYKNDPLCKTVGYGFTWDGECGFDSVDCCDLFECLGGYGVIFDNSDLVNVLPLNEIESVTDTLRVSGNNTYDVRAQIESIPTYDSIVVRGDIRPQLAFQKLFLVVPIRTLNVDTNTDTQINIKGNYAQELVNEGRFKLYNTNPDDDDMYTVLSATYESITNTTSIQISTSKPITPGLENAIVEYKIGNKNNGAYLIESYTFDGSFTTINLHSTTQTSFTNTTEGSNHGSIQLRTGMLPNRYIDIEETGTDSDGQYKIILSEYDVSSNETIVHLADLVPTTASTGFVKLYGYVNTAGFDGYGECSTPKHSHVKVGISEKLVIEYVYLAPTPTPSPILPTYPSVVTWFEFNEDATKAKPVITNENPHDASGSAFVKTAYWDETTGDRTTDIRSEDYDPMNMTNIVERMRVTEPWQNPIGLYFTPDGSRLFISDFWNAGISEYNINKPWSIEGAHIPEAKFFSWIDGGTLSSTFSRDGRYFYFYGSWEDNIYQVELRTPWDITSAYTAFTSSDTNYNVGDQNGIEFSADGLIMYEYNRDYLSRYTLSTPWDVTTLDPLSYTDVDLSAQGFDYGGAFSFDGTKFYGLGDSPTWPPNYIAIFSYSLSTPWDISTITYDGVYADVAEATHTGARALHISDDSSRLYILGEEGNYITQYLLSTPGDLSTASIEGRFEINFWDGVPQDMYISRDGTKMFILNEFGSDIMTFTLSTPWDTTTATFDGNRRNFYHPDVEDIGRWSQPLGATFKPDGSVMYITTDERNPNNWKIYQVTCSTPWDINAAPIASELTISTEAHGIQFSSDGTKFFVTSGESDYIGEYTLGTPWDITTSLSGGTPSATKSTGEFPVGLKFNPDGTEMYVMTRVISTPGAYANLEQYTLGTAWDVTSATLTRSHNFDYLEGDSKQIYGIEISADGSKFYTVHGYDAIYEFDMTTPWDISTIRDEDMVTGREYSVLSNNSTSGWDTGSTRAESFNFDNDWFHWIWCEPMDDTTDKTLINVGADGIGIGGEGDGWFLMLRGRGLRYVGVGSNPYIPYDEEISVTDTWGSHRNEIAFVCRNNDAGTDDEVLLFSEEYQRFERYMICVQWDSTLGRMGVSVNGSPFEWHTVSNIPSNPTTITGDNQWLYANMALDETTTGHKFQGNIGQAVHGDVLLADGDINFFYNGGDGFEYHDLYDVPEWWIQDANINVIAWLDASDTTWVSSGSSEGEIVSTPGNGDSVSGWVNNSGTMPSWRSLSNATYRTNAFNGNNVVRVTGAVNVPSEGNVITDYTNVAMFWVTSNITSSSEDTFFSSTDTSDARIRLYDSTVDDGPIASFYPDGGTPLTLTHGSGNAPVGGEVVIRAMSKVGTMVKAFYNGALVDSGTLDADSFVSDESWIFCNDQTAVDGLNADVGEFIFIQGDLSDYQMELISDSLLLKWKAIEASPTPTPTVTPTNTPTSTVTPTVTPTSTVTPTVTPTNTVTATVTPTVTPTVTAAITPTATVTPTVTATVTPTVTPTPSVTNTLPLDMVAWWSMDEASGTRADSHASNDLTETGTVPQSTGLINGSTDTLANSNNYLSCPRTNFLGGNRDFSIAFWCWSNSGGTTQHLFHNGLISSISATSTDWRIRLEGNAYHFDVSDGTNYNTVSTGAYTTSTWQLITAWHDSVSGEIGISLDNGTPVINSSITTPASVSTGSMFVLRGGIGFESKSRVDEAAFWDKVLSAGEITTLYNGGSGIGYPGP